MNELISNRMLFAFQGLMGGGISFAYLFSFLGLHNITGCLIGTIIGGLLGYIFGRKIDLKEEKN